MSQLTWESSKYYIYVHINVYVTVDMGIQYILVYNVYVTVDMGIQYILIYSVYVTVDMGIQYIIIYNTTNVYMSQLTWESSTYIYIYIYICTY